MGEPYMWLMPEKLEQEQLPGIDWIKYEKFRRVIWSEYLRMKLLDEVELAGIVVEKSDG